MTTKQDYRNFKHNTLYPWCWACGRDESQRPDRWFAPWGVDKAHLLSSYRKRVEDVRLISLLCCLCHKRYDGSIISSCPGHDWPRLTLANLLWVKERWDPANFDIAFIQRHSISTLPDPAPLPECYIEAYRARRHAA